MNYRQIAFLLLSLAVMACGKDAIAEYDEASLDISPRYGLVPYDGPLASDAALDQKDGHRREGENGELQQEFRQAVKIPRLLAKTAGWLK